MVVKTFAIALITAEIPCPMDEKTLPIDDWMDGWMVCVVFGLVQGGFLEATRPFYSSVPLLYARSDHRHRALTSRPGQARSGEEEHIVVLLRNDATLELCSRAICLFEFSSETYVSRDNDVILHTGNGNRV
jgi:hypothetical protein